MDFSSEGSIRLYILKRMTADNCYAMPPIPTFSRSFSTFSRSFFTFSCPFGLVFTHSDTFGYIRIHSDAFGRKKIEKKIFQKKKCFEDLEGHHETCEVPIWRSCEFLSVTSRFVSKSYPRCPKIQLSAIFGGGVKS